MHSKEKDFEEAVDFVHGLNKFGWKLGLERFSALCEMMGNPHEKLRVVHIGGTNGKGSTTTMVSSILQKAGYRVGAYYSPYVYDIRERVQVDGRFIEKDAFTRLVNTVRPYAQALARTKHGHPTEFEVKTLVGFLYFLERKVDFAVLEVGLGGRLDATNVVMPVVSVITNVTLDHMDKLGNTIPDIAREKAGIIKENGHLVTASTHHEAFVVLRHACEERNSDLWLVHPSSRAGEDFIVSPVLPGQVCSAASFQGTLGDNVTVKGVNATYDHLTLSLKGDFQYINAATAIAAAEVLQNKGVRINESAIQAGLRSAYIQGRLEVLRESPKLVIDGAHNLDGARNVAAALKKHFKYDRLILVMGMVRGHSIEDVIGNLAPLADKFIATAAGNPRAASAEDVAQVAQRHCPDVLVMESVISAVNRALEMAGPDDLVCVTGSFYTIGEVPRP